MQAKHMNPIPLVALVLALALVGTTQAKELVKVTIVGPGLTRGVELTDAERLRVFRDLRFADQITQPASTETQPYFELRLGVGTSTKIVATNVYRYYPATRAHPSYIYYADVINGWSSIEGQYFLLPDDQDQAVRNLLISLGASLPSMEVQATPAHTLPATGQNGLPTLWLILASCFCIGVGIALKLRRPAR